MRDDQTRPAVSPGTRSLLWIERVLIVVGSAALIWCALAGADGLMAQRAARRTLEAAMPVAASPQVAAAPAVAPAGSSSEPRGTATLTRGSVIGTLSIPRVHLSAVVLHGSDAQTLRRGPGQLENTALPGRPGNTVIAGHRDSFFWPLRNIQLADDIVIETPAGRFRYRVTSVRVVGARDVSVLAATDEPVLTLITCYPFWVFGNAPDRFVVRATAVGRATPASRVEETAAAPDAVVNVPDPLAVRQATFVQANPSQRVADTGGRAATDDAVLVRLAVERYRVTYNGRLISRGEDRDGALMMFDGCEVAIEGDRATAVCTSSPRSGWGSGRRTFLLDRTAVGWGIRSVVVE